MECKVVHDPRGYYTLYVNGKFYGNYDTVSEAIAEYESQMCEDNDHDI